MSEWLPKGVLPLAAVTLIVAAACGGGNSSNVVRRPESPTSSPGTSAPAATATTSPAAGHKVHPAVVVSPSTRLKARQTVQVVATGFSPGESLQVVQCADKGKATAPGDCNLSAMLPIKADASGRLSTHLRVVRGPFGGNGIVCGPKQRCLVSVTQASLNPTEEADAPITFAPVRSG